MVRPYFRNTFVRDPDRLPQGQGARTKTYPQWYDEFVATPAVRQSDGSRRVAVILLWRVVAPRNCSLRYCFLVAPRATAKSRATRAEGIAEIGSHAGPGLPSRVHGVRFPASPPLRWIGGSYFFIFFSSSAIAMVVLTTVSGFKEMLSIPFDTRNCAKSG